MTAHRTGLLVAAALLVVTSAPVSAAPPPIQTVSMIHFEYEPERSMIPAGGRIRWTYDEDMLDPQPNCESVYLQTLPGIQCPGHSATAVARGRNGKPLFDTGVYRAEGFPQTFPFKSPGVFRYYCTVHGGDNASPLTSMNGVVIVEPSRGKLVTDGNDVTGPIDLRALTAQRNGQGGLVVTVTSWHAWTASALPERGPRRLEVVFDVDTDGAIGENDVVARVVSAKGRLVVRLRGADGTSTLPTRRVGSAGVRFTLPASSSAANTDADHQLAASTRSPADRVPAFPGWLPLAAA